MVATAPTLTIPLPLQLYIGVVNLAILGVAEWLDNNELLQPLLNPVLGRDGLHFFFGTGLYLFEGELVPENNHLGILLGLLMLLGVGHQASRLLL